MDISKISDSWRNCKETQQIRNAAAYGCKVANDNKELAIQMLKDGVSNVVVHEKTGINKSSISIYKSELKLS